MQSENEHSKAIEEAILQGLTASRVPLDAYEIARETGYELDILFPIIDVLLQAGRISAITGTGWHVPIYTIAERANYYGSNTNEGKD